MPAARRRAPLAWLRVRGTGLGRGRHLPHGLEIVRRAAASVLIDGDEDGRTIWVLLPWEAKG